MLRKLSMISLFEIFIKDTVSGKRRKLNAQKIKPQTIENYRNTLKLLSEYECYTHKKLMIKSEIRGNSRLLFQEKRRWNEFYYSFSRFLFYKKGCHDNYCGHVFKIIKCFFRYMVAEKFLLLPGYYNKFYVRKEDIGIITLLPERLCSLVMDTNLTGCLNPIQSRCRDIFIFGCISALRFSDLLNLEIRDIEIRGTDFFLNYRSLKTETRAKVKLPSFAILIFEKYSINKIASDKLFPSISLFWFNKNLRKIGLLAGWVETIGKFRTIDGEPIEFKKKQNIPYRFCDLITSHVMRRTGITVLLMLGMPEYLVRKISGHSAHSKSFFRYVNFAQSYITDEISKVHLQLFQMSREQVR
jgi:integrase